MNVLIIGGRLQGLEIAYLAKKAGCRAVLADKNKDVPAAGIADAFITADVFDEAKTLALFNKADAVLPAAENINVLDKLLEYGKKTHTPVIYDKRCYEISSSKKRSNELFAALGLPAPLPYPQCGFPVIVKPDGSSGSRGVKTAQNAEELDKILPLYDKPPIIQEFINGRGLSMEVIGSGETYRLLPVTDVISGDDFDCTGITSPADISEPVKKQFLEIGGKIAEALKINGIFDIEAIERDGELKLLEIDARFPSQTPSSVYHSYGINMVKTLLEPNRPQAEKTKPDVCLYRQVLCEKNKVTFMGEHIISNRSGLKIIKGFFGADEAVTDYTPASEEWAAILIITADTLEKAEWKLRESVKNMEAGAYVEADGE